jgi:hypothetical protein
MNPSLLNFQEASLRVLNQTRMHNSFATKLNVQLIIPLWKYDVMVHSLSAFTFPILSLFNYINSFLSGLKQISYSGPYYIRTLCENFAIIICVDNHSKEKNINYGQMQIYFKNILWYVNLLLRNEMLNKLPRSQTLDKQSVAGLRNNRTVLCNPFLGNGSVNRLPRRHNEVILERWRECHVTLLCPRWWTVAMQRAHCVHLDYATVGMVITWHEFSFHAVSVPRLYEAVSSSEQLVLWRALRSWVTRR